MNLKTLIGLLFVFFISSCTPIFLGLYGINNSPKKISLKQLENFSTKQGIKEYYILDTGYCRSLRSKVPGPNLNDFQQPLQIKVFDKLNDSLIAYTVNCEVGGFPNLHWKRYAKLDSVLKGSKQSCDTMESFTSAITYLRDKSIKPTVLIGEAEIEVLVYYTVFMKRQSKRLIRYLNEVKANFPSDGIQYRFVHCDYLFSEFADK
ncbi:MAG: hypothetical protein MUF75_13015 [Bacteroidia bacterium]|jgi:hypothetical protein|nr:hypothetical protein [Bacteroidia bacterium]